MKSLKTIAGVYAAGLLTGVLVMSPGGSIGLVMIGLIALFAYLLVNHSMTGDKSGTSPEDKSSVLDNMIDSILDLADRFATKLEDKVNERDKSDGPEL